MAQQKKPAPSGKKGGNGAGTTTSIASRLAQQEDSRNRRKAEQRRRERGAMMRDNKPATEQLTVFSTEEMLDGKAGNGSLFEANGSIFELGTNGGRQVYTLKKGNGDLAKWTSQAENVFVFVQDLLRDSYTPRLRGTLADKQGMMWQAVALSMDNAMINTLSGRLKHEQQETEATTFAEMQAERFIGQADPSIWLTAVGDPAKFEDGFKGLKEDGKVNLRLGATSDTGIVASISYNGDSLHITPIHVGKMCVMTGVVLKGTHLRCKTGRLDENKPEIKGDRGESIASIWSFVMGLDRKVRDPLMHGMYHAYRRLHNQPPKLVASNGMQVKQALTAIVNVAPAPASMQETKSTPVKPTGKITKATVIQYAFSVMPADKAAELSASKMSTKLMLDHIDNFVAAKQAQATKSA